MFSGLGTALLGILVFVLIFSVLIIFHELGHFFMARLARVKVEEFGFGLPPKIWGKKTKYETESVGKDGKKERIREEMIWTINAIPFGGFVRMLGEDSDKQCKGNPRAFCNRPLAWRIAITLAGVTMNFLLAFLLFVTVAWSGFNPIIDPNLSFHPRFESYFSDGHVDRWVEKGFYEKREGGAFVLAVDPESPAGQAGILPGDQIVAVNDVSVESREELQNLQQEDAEEFSYTVQRFHPDTRNFETFAKTIRPESEEGTKILGVLLVEKFYYPMREVKLPPAEAFTEAVSTSKRLVVLSVDTIQDILASTLGKVVRREVPEIPEGVGGPVAIWDSTRQLVAIGDTSKIIQFAAILSLSLAVMNLVPFPALDGGRFFFQLLELVFFLLTWPIKKIFPKKKIPHRIPANLEGIIHVIGYSLLLIFILAVTWRDIGRIFF